jgi:hypothetical protein
LTLPKFVEKYLPYSPKSITRKYAYKTMETRNSSKFLTKYDKVFSSFYTEFPQFTVDNNPNYNEEWQEIVVKFIKFKIQLLKGENWLGGSKSLLYL